jgi:hypothetical protein
MPPPTSSSPRESFPFFLVDPLLTPLLCLLRSNVANHFPNLLASIIVRSYHTPLPGELSQKWKNEQSSTLITRLLSRYDRTCQRNLRLFLSLLVIDFLHSLGSIDPGLQKFILHNLQPLVLGALFLFGLTLWRYPLSFIGVGILLLLGFGSLLYRSQEQKGEEKDGLSAPERGRTLSSCEKNGQQDVQTSEKQERSAGLLLSVSSSLSPSPSCSLIPVSPIPRLTNHLRRDAVAPLDDEGVLGFDLQERGKSNNHGEDDGESWNAESGWSSDLEKLMNSDEEDDDEWRSENSDSVWDIRGDDLCSSPSASADHYSLPSSSSFSSFYFSSSSSNSDRTPHRNEMK